MYRPTLDIEGKRYVLIEENELRRLENRKGGRKPGSASKFPPFPKADSEDNVPAIDYARVSIARDIAQRRKAVGMTQEQLARAAGIRQESLSRLEAAKHSSTVRTIDRIERALKNAESKR